MKALEQIDTIEQKLTEMARAWDGVQSQTPHGLPTGLKNVFRYAQALFKLAPFQIGDRVQIVEKIDFERAPGWQGHEDTLIVGACCTVTDVVYQECGFQIQICPEEQWYIDWNGDRKEPYHPSHFTMHPNKLELIYEKG